eukprot:103889_1
MYEYCCNSKNKDEFNLKLIVVNYVCIKSYVKTLTRSYDIDYYEFAQKLSNATWPELDNFALHEFDNIVKNKLDANQNMYIFKFINFKLGQFFIRTIFIVSCLLLDIFYLKTFRIGSLFMNHYGDSAAIFGILCMLLFCVWIISIIYQLFISKWSKFCYYMIASKHGSFVFFQSVEDFQNECDDAVACIEEMRIHNVMNTRQKSGINYLQESEEGYWFERIKKFLVVDNLVSNEYSQNIFVTIYGSIPVFINCGIILGMSFVATRQDTVEYCSSNAVILTYNLIVTCIILLICLKHLWFYFRSEKLFMELFGSNVTEFLLGAFCFSLFSSQLLVHCYMKYFYESEQCNRHHSWTILILLQLSGCLIYITPWILLLSAGTVYIYVYTIIFYPMVNLLLFGAITLVIIMFIISLIALRHGNHAWFPVMSYALQLFTFIANINIMLEIVHHDGFENNLTIKICGILCIVFLTLSYVGNLCFTASKLSSVDNCHAAVLLVLVTICSSYYPTLQIASSNIFGINFSLGDGIDLASLNKTKANAWMFIERLPLLIIEIIYVDSLNGISINAYSALIASSIAVTINLCVCFFGFISDFVGGRRRF